MRSMNETKATTKKAPATGEKRKVRRPPLRPLYPESYRYARGSRSGWRSGERNA